MSLAALIRDMAAAGATPEAIAIAVAAIETVKAKEAARHAKSYTPRHSQTGWTPRLPEREWLPLTGVIYRRDGYICAYWETLSGPFQTDYIVPVKRGGSLSKGDRLLSEWRGRYR